MDVQKNLDLAIKCHLAGRLQEAIERYENIQSVYEKDARFLFLLGTAYGQLGQMVRSIELLDKSIGLDASNSEAFHNLGAALEAAGLIGLSLLCYQRAFTQKPDYAEAHYAYGNALKRLNRFDEALMSYRTAIHIKPKYSEPYNNSGVVNHDLKKYGIAIDCFDVAISLNPRYVEAYNNRGNTLCALKRYGEALVNYDQAIALRPDYAIAWSNRGNALMNLKRFNDSLFSFNEALKINPDHSESYNNRGLVQEKIGHIDEALESYGKAIKVNNDYAEAYLNRGHLLTKMGCYDQALLSYAKALALNPDLPFVQGAYVHTKMHLCDWNNVGYEIETIISRIDRGELAIQPFPLLALVDDPVRHLAAAELFVNYLIPIKQSYPISQINSSRKVAIGYYSADFYDHATLHLMLEVFLSHDTSRFDVYAFSFGSIKNDPWQAKLKSCCHQLIDCSELADGEVVELSRRIGIDIAIDLKGFTQDARPGLFSARVAPIQINFLGYPGSMGVDCIDYIIADQIVIREEYRCFYSEKVAYLPQCYQPNRRISEGNYSQLSRADLGLPEAGFVFCSFNSSYKITEDIFISWMNLLKDVEGSILWLLVTNSVAELNIKREAYKNGVDPARLIFAKKASHDKHLERLCLADLMLDTFPCGAHTTCSDALRVGLPIVTIQGKSFASRVAASLMTEIGLSELIANTMEEYQSIAKRLANQHDQLMKVRERLLIGLTRSSLYDPERFCSNFECLLLKIHDRYTSGLLPDHIH